MGICGIERECLIGKDKKRKYKKPNNNKIDSIKNISGSKDNSYFKPDEPGNDKKERFKRYKQYFKFNA